MKTFTSLLVTILLLFGTSEAAFSKDHPGKNKPRHKKNENSEQIRLRLPLVPADLGVEDLASARGSINYREKRKKIQFKLKVAIPNPAPSLGLVDRTTAENTEIRLEQLRGEEVVNDCVLKLMGSSDDLSEGSFKYRLHGRVGGSSRASRMIKGSCINGVPQLEQDDLIQIYSVIGEDRVEILKSQNS